MTRAGSSHKARASGVRRPFIANTLRFFPTPSRRIRKLLEIDVKTRGNPLIGRVFPRRAAVAAGVSRGPTTDSARVPPLPGGVVAASEGRRWLNRYVRDSWFSRYGWVSRYGWLVRGRALPCCPRQAGRRSRRQRCSSRNLTSTGQCTTPDVPHRLIPSGRCRAKAVGRSEISARTGCPCRARRSAR
jgi:hypothetical protein